MGCQGSKGVAVSSAKGNRFYDKFELGDKLGEGSFGQVRIAKARRRSHTSGAGEPEYAAKIMSLQVVGESKIDKQLLRDIENESDLQKTIGRHPNCVHLLDTFREEFLYFIVMEKCRESLLQRLTQRKIVVPSFPKMFKEMLSGIAHVHNCGIVHRDIKPDNFLFGGPEGETLKLADFGLSAPMPAEGGLHGTTGTAPYMSPEMVCGSPYDQRTDVWSFGVVVYLLVFNKFPYSPPAAKSDAMKQAIRKDTPKLQIVCKSAATRFLSALLQRQPQDRCNAEQALKLDFINESAPEQVPTGLDKSASVKTLVGPFEKPTNEGMNKGLDDLFNKFDGGRNIPIGGSVKALAEDVLARQGTQQGAVLTFDFAGAYQTNDYEGDVREDVSTCDTLPNMIATTSSEVSVCDTTSECSTVSDDW